MFSVLNSFPITPALLGYVRGGSLPVTGASNGTQFVAPTAQPATPVEPLSKAFPGKLDQPLSLAKNYDKLARELAVRDPQLLAMVGSYKAVEGATFTIARVRTATAGGPEFTETIRISAGTKTGGPSGKAPTGGADISFTFASLGLTIIIDQLLAPHIASPYKRGGVVVGSFALASRLSTGNWAQGKGALEGWVQFNFLNNITTSMLDIMGVKDPKALAYGSAGITAATLLTHQLMKRGEQLTLNAVTTVAESRGLSLGVSGVVGKVFKVVAIVDFVGGIAEDIKYDTTDNRTAIYVNYERDEMRDRAPTGLKWTTNFSLVRWPMRWFGGADEAADRKADEYIASQVVPQLNELAGAVEAQLLSAAADAVSYAQLNMVDPCLVDVAANSVDSKQKIRKACTIAASEQLLELRKKELKRAGIIPSAKNGVGADVAYWTEEPWKTEGVWDESDESLRFQFWEHLKKSTYFDPNFNIGKMNTFKDAFIWNKTVSRLDAAKPWNDLTAFITADGGITDHRAFGEYLKAPVLKRCDQVTSDMTGNLIALAETCFSPDGTSFDREKFAKVLSSYYNTPDFNDGIREFYDLLVIDSVHGGASKGQEIAQAFDVHGKIKDMDAAMMFLMKAFYERNKNAEGEFRKTLLLSGLNPDTAVTTDPVTGAVTVRADLITPAIEQSIKDKGGDVLARNMLLLPDQEDALYYSLVSPLSREWVDTYVTGTKPAQPVASL